MPGVRRLCAESLDSAMKSSVCHPLSAGPMKPRNEYVRRLDVLLDRGVVPEELANTEAAAKNLRREHASRCHQRLGRGKCRGGVQSDPAQPVLRVRASYPVSP
ncbi:hypothetical protein Smlt1657 [Stenotrophomonas maltophilia K279a]|uniref:Uncharacterized protein n=2 Tax=Stenotrophomonas maltophilia TaxID=40324 RepID=B2FK35_STRMK|nr:hypothetical protein Smlt1657 [Stenotrophomonas maltophilia K279a]